MKKIIDLITKPTGLIILMCVFIIAGPAAGFFVARGLNKDLQTTRETEAKSDNDKLKRAEVSYSLGPILPGEESLEVRRVPHPQLTEHFKALRERRAAQVEIVVQRALERNQAGHTPLIEGLLPEPPERDSQLLRLQMQDMIVGKDDSPSVLTGFLDEVNAGMPPDANEIASLLEEYRQGEVERHKAETGSEDMSVEQQKTLQENLIKRRVGEYQRKASDISVYAGMEVMPSIFPRSVGNETPSVVECFEWQWDYWMVQDIFDAVKTANSTDDGELTSVPESPIKRVLKIETTPLPGVWPESYAINRSLSSTGPLIATDPMFSLTGRVSHSDNELYDVRPASISMVVSSARLLEVIEAISATNFMTVTDLDISEVDLWDHLRLGFYYGSEHVVKVDMVVETIWLRRWTAPYIPEQVRPLMSVEDPA